MANRITKPQPPRGKFIIRENDGEEPRFSIVLQYIVDSKTAKVTFGIRINQNQWDERNQRIVRHSNQARLNDMLESFKNDFDMLILEQFKKRQWIHINDLRYILANHRLPGEKVEVIAIGKEIYDNAKKQGKISSSTHTNGMCALKIFREYIAAKHPEWGDEYSLTDSLIDEYITWRKTERGNSNETINKAITPLVRVAERLWVMNRMSAEMYDKISKMYLAPEKRSLAASELDSDDVHFLTHDEFGKLLVYKDNCKLQRTIDYLDMYCFATFTGLRWSDIVSLEWGHLDMEKRVIRKVLVKGKRREVLTLELPSAAINLLMKWQVKTGSRRFVFGLLKDDADLDDGDFLRYAVQTKARSMNTVLTRVATEIGVERLTFHMARHTFAIWALNDRQYSIKRISSLLGHSTITTTERYYAKYIPDYEGAA